MLIITRKIGESFWVGEKIRITITGMKGNQTRIGIDAPKEIIVLREEVKERIEAEGRESAL